MLHLQVLGETGNKTLFLPRGEYLVSQTLLLNRTNGVGIFGCGSDTVLSWRGDPQGRLFWSDGNTRFTIQGENGNPREPRQYLHHRPNPMPL